MADIALSIGVESVEAAQFRADVLCKRVLVGASSYDAKDANLMEMRPAYSALGFGAACKHFFGFHLTL
jgi:hypothetical protein